MDYASLPIRSVMFSMSTFGAIIGLMVGLGIDLKNKNHIWLFMSGFSMLFTLIGWRIVKWMAEKSEEAVYYESETETPVITERVTLIINVPELPKKRIHGISRDELQAIGECVTSNENEYKFSSQHFKDYFKATEYNGYSLYSKSVRWMQDCGALVPNAKGGFDVTEHIGKHVFEAMRDGTWEELEERI